MTNTPTLVTPVLGAATATSINGITITGTGLLTLAGNIDTSSIGGSINTTISGGSINTANSGGGLDTSSSGGSINTYSSGGSINTSGGGGSINTQGTGSIGLGNAAANTMTTFTGAASGSNKSIALPNADGTLVLNDNTATLTNKDIVATQLSGNIAVARIATALTTPGAIGGTTASTGAFTTLTSSNTTDSTTTATGAVQTLGGLGVAKSIFAGGNINIPATTSTVGQIKQAGSRILHTYGTQNLFLGDGAGNFTLTGQANTGIGRVALNSITSGGQNIALGDGTLFLLTSGSDNLAIGRSSLNALVSGAQNTAVGASALLVATGSNSVGIGMQAGYALGSGNNNVSIGQNSLLNAVNSYATLSSTSNCTLLGTLAEVTTSGQTTASYRTAIGSESNATADNQVMLGRAADIVTLPGGLVTVPVAQTATTVAVSVAVTTTALTTTGVAQAITLANGTNGQIKIITHIANGGTGTAVLTPATSAADYSTITFSSVGDTATLQYHTTGGWYILSLRGAVAA
jgi:hypothetical protein